MLPLAPLLAVVHAAAAEPIPEEDLVRAFLEGPVGTTQATAAEAQQRADGTAGPLLANPELEVRHEAPAGSVSDAIGGSMVFDLGLVALTERGAAGLLGDAAGERGKAMRLASICDLRRDAVDLWAAGVSRQTIADGQALLEDLVGTLGELAAAGEASGYDRDRTELEVATHRLDADRAQGSLLDLQAHLSSTTGTPVTAVTLRPLGPLPALEDLPQRVESHPALVSSTLGRDADGKLEAAARRAFLPDLRVSAAQRFDSIGQADAVAGFEVGAAVEVPLFDQGRATTRTAAASHRASEASTADLRAALTAAATGAWGRATALQQDVPDRVEPTAIWVAATTRYTAGESTLEDLLQTADAVEHARLAAIERQRLLRRAHLDVACATGTFTDPAMQALLEFR